MFALRGGVVPVPRWVLALRALQFIFAILIIGLTSYCLSVEDGREIRPALITDLVIACLTIVPILTIVTALHPLQRRFFDPRVALVLDGFACLFWLAATAALACYQRIYRGYVHSDKRSEPFTLRSKAGILERDTEAVTVTTITETSDPHYRRAWRTGAAAAWFSGFEFVLFLLTTLLFLYYYHLHLAGTPYMAPIATTPVRPVTTSTGAPISHSTGAVPVSEAEHTMQPILEQQVPLAPVAPTVPAPGVGPPYPVDKREAGAIV